MVSTVARRGVNASAAIKVPCIAASTGNLTLSGEQTVDGIALVEDDRVFAKDQTDTTEIGIYTVSTGTWTRALDFDGAYDVVEGTIIPVSRGTTNADTEFRISTTGTIDIGTTPLSVEARGASDSSNQTFLQAGTGAVSRTTQAKLREVFSVTDFGATGDGVTDDSASINSAITAAGTGGTLFFPEGVYIFTPTLTQLSGQTWRGDGCASSILRVDPAASTYIKAIVTADSAEDYTFEDLQIDGNRGNVTPTTNLYSNYYLLCGPSAGKRGTYKNLILANSWGRTLQTGQESGTITEDILVHNVKVVNSGTKGISATNTKRITISDCFSEVNAYTVAENPSSTAATSGSCIESNGSQDVVISGCHGIQIDPVVSAPGIRLINESSMVKAYGNTITDATYLGFIQNSNDVHFSDNVGRDIKGNAILIADDDVSESTIKCERIYVHNNTIYDPDDAYVLIKASKDGFNAFVECYIHDNNFVQVSGTPTAGIYNDGVIAPATGGTCLVYAWDNTFTGTIPNEKAGAAVDEIQPKPTRGWEILSQSGVAVSHTGDTNETNLATVALPAYKIGPNGRVRVSAHWSHTNSANNKICRIKFGGSALHAITNTTTAQSRAQVEMVNRNSLSSQVVSMFGGDSGFGATTSALSTLSLDTATSLNIQVSGELANSGETITMESYIIEVYYEL
jgi:hypothetical protein